jgi:hypothetical protein
MLAALTRWFNQASDEVGFWPAVLLFASPLILFGILVILVGIGSAAKDGATLRKDMKKGVGSYRFVLDMVSLAALIDDRDRQLAQGMRFSSDRSIIEILGQRAYEGVVKVFGEAYADINPRYMAAFTFLKDNPDRALDFARTHPHFKAARKHCEETYKDLIILCAYCALQLNLEPVSTTIHDDGLFALAADLYGSEEIANRKINGENGVGGLFLRSDQLVNQAPADAPAA